MEKIFPFLGVRFIAVNDRYDSEGEIFKEKDLIADFKSRRHTFSKQICERAWCEEI